MTKKPASKKKAAPKKATKPTARRTVSFGKVIVRCRDAGVHYGTYAGHQGREVRLTKSRRLWWWKAAQGISLSAVAEHGVAGESRIADTVPQIVLLDACEIIACSPKAAASIEGAPCAQAK